MTAGMRPRRRSSRAAPLPVTLRGSAERVAWVAITLCPLLLLFEQRAHREIAVGITNPLSHQWRDRKDLQVLELPVVGQGDRVGDRHFLDRRLRQPLTGRA